MPERFVDFAFPPDQRRETYQFQSAWLASSLGALRSRGLLDDYRAKLPKPLHATILGSVPGVWLPVEVAAAHYAAFDALRIAPATILEMGRDVNQRSHSVLIDLTIRGSREVGVTPWVIFRQFRKLWDRTWRGGDFAIEKFGPKEAYLEVVEWTIAPSPYVRLVMRGVFEGLIGMFCEKVYVHDVPAKCRGLALGYRLSWV